MTSNCPDKKNLDQQRLMLAWNALNSGDYATALTEFSAMAEKGHSDAWLNLGLLHKKGLGVPQDNSKAEIYCKKAIELGSVDALIRLGRMYKDSGASQEAFACFLQAADKGYLPGFFWVGRAYLTGFGTEKDIEKGKVYLRTAMDRGHVLARTEYCRAQIRGDFGSVQRVAGFFGIFKAITATVKALGSDPYGDRVR
jgi:TPR repeat protein